MAHHDAPAIECQKRSKAGSVGAADCWQVDPSSSPTDPFMLLPFRHRGSTSEVLDPKHLESRIAERNQRLVIGIATASSQGAASPACTSGVHCRCDQCLWTEFRGVLMLARGHGKHLRVQHAITESRELPPHLVTALASVMARPLHSRLDDVCQLADDLTAILVELTAALQRSAGKYVDRITCVSIDGPSIWQRDFDGRPLYRPIIEPTLLAHHSGLTVVDDFPRRDLLASGNGRPLQPLPLWLALGDRRSPVASQTRVVVQLGLECRITTLPPSDGLDDWLPNVQYIQAVNPLNGAARLAPEWNDREWLELYSNGSATPTLVSAMEAWMRESSSPLDFAASIASGEENAPPSHNGCGGQNSWDSPPADLPASCLREMQPIISRENRSTESSEPPSAADMIRSATRALVTFVHEQVIDPIAGESNVELLVEADDWQSTLFLTEWNQQHPNCPVRRTESGDIPSGFLDPCCIAMLGLLHLDQFPANHPDITGAEHQRLLGRLTPGRPENWRWVIRSMADYHPPAMRLRDAI